MIVRRGGVLEHVQFRPQRAAAIDVPAAATAMATLTAGNGSGTVHFAPRRP